jgi:hypothetical protein
MAQTRRAVEDAAGPATMAAEDDLDSAAAVAIDLGGDLARAVRRAAAEQRRLVVREGDREIAAIIPLEDLRLLLRLEEEELDRIDQAELRRALADPDNYPPIPWEQVKREAGL